MEDVIDNECDAHSDSKEELIEWFSLWGDADDKKFDTTTQDTEYLISGYLENWELERDNILHKALLNTIDWDDLDAFLHKLYEQKKSEWSVGEGEGEGSEEEEGGCGCSQDGDGEDD